MKILDIGYKLILAIAGLTCIASYFESHDSQRIVIDGGDVFLEQISTTGDTVPNGQLEYCGSGTVLSAGTGCAVSVWQQFGSITLSPSTSGSVTLPVPSGGAAGSYANTNISVSSSGRITPAVNK